MAEPSVKNKKQRRPLPKPPSPMPWFTLGAGLFLWGLYSLFHGWPWMALLTLAMVPIVSAILPMEIQDFRRRKRICEHIKRDFLEDITSGNQHAQFFESLHAAPERRFREPVKPQWQKTASDYSHPSRRPD